MRKGTVLRRPEALAPFVTSERFVAVLRAAVHDLWEEVVGVGACARGEGAGSGGPRLAGDVLCWDRRKGGWGLPGRFEGSGAFVHGDEKGVRAAEQRRSWNGRLRTVLRSVIMIAVQASG